jgi:hypothetical protein
LSPSRARISVLFDRGIAGRSVMDNKLFMRTGEISDNLAFVRIVDSIIDNYTIT